MMLGMLMPALAANHQLTIKVYGGGAVAVDVPALTQLGLNGSATLHGDTARSWTLTDELIAQGVLSAVLQFTPDEGFSIGQVLINDAYDVTQYAAVGVPFQFNGQQSVTTAGAIDAYVNNTLVASNITDVEIAVWYTGQRVQVSNGHYDDDGITWLGGSDYGTVSCPSVADAYPEGFDTQVGYGTDLTVYFHPEDGCRLTSLVLERWDEEQQDYVKTDVMADVVNNSYTITNITGQTNLWVVFGPITEQDGDTFTTQTAESLDMTFKIISVADKTCQVGDGSHLCVSEDATVVNVPAVANGYSVIAVGDNAFLRGSSLTGVYLPSSVTTIGNRAFEGCQSLTSITLPESVTTIGDNAFRNCYNLATVSLESNITSIGEGAFYNNTSLTTIALPAGLTAIANSTFYASGLTSITIPEGVRSIGTSAFYNNGSLATVEFPASLLAIGDDAFALCGALTAINLPSSLTTIGQSAFGNCEQVTELTIPASVTSIGDFGFAINALRTVTAEGTTPATIGESTFTGSTTGDGVLYVPSAARADYQAATGWSNFSTIRSIGATLEPYAVLSENNTVLTFYYDYDKESRNGMSVGPFGTWSGPGWKNVRQSITTVVFDSSFANCTSITSTAFWFYNCLSLTSITDIQNLKTDNVTDMQYMFWDCAALTSLDVSHFNTGNVTNMSNMFYLCEALTNLDVSNFTTDNVTDMSNMFYSCKVLTSLDVSNFNTLNVTNMGGMFGSCWALATLDVSGFKTDNVTSMAGMFNACHNLTSLDVSGFTTDNVTNMGTMFEGCSKLTTIDVSGFKTDNVTSMGRMFYSCTGVTNLDVSGFKTDKVTSMAYMFRSCSALTSLDVSSFNTDNVTDMQQMFFLCSGLSTLDLSSFNTSKVQNMNQMFNSCSGLNTIYVSDLWSTAVVTNSTDMFRGCTALVGGNGTTFAAAHTNGEYARIDGGTAAPGYFTEAGAQVATPTFSWSGDMLTIETATPGAYIEYSLSEVTGALIDSTLYTGPIEITRDVIIRAVAGKTMMTQSEPAVLNYPYTEWANLLAVISSAKATAEQAQGNDNVSAEELADLNAQITAAESSYANRTATESDIQQMATGIRQLASTIEEEAAAVDEPYAVLNENYTVLTFYYDKQKEQRGGMGIGPFTNAYYRNWNSNAGSIKSVVFDESFANYSALTSTAYWFYDCSNLTTITGIANLNTANVTNMRGMFYGCSGLTSLDLSNFNTGNVTNLKEMFYGCSKLTSLNVSNFNTANVTDMSSMFRGCSLTSLDVSNFNTANVTDMSSMFSGCSSLTSLDVSNFNTANVTDMSAMFFYCSGLSTLDLSSFNTSKVQNMSNMFYLCSGLTTIYVSDLWSTAVVTNSSDMFISCTSLVGGQGTTYDSSHTNVEYARIDHGPNSQTPGYFTDKEVAKWDVWSVIGTINGSWDTDTDMGTEDGVHYTTTITVAEAGGYEYKVRANNDWTLNYGADGQQNGSNIVVNVPEDGTSVTINFDAETHAITHTVNLVYCVAGSFNEWNVNGDNEMTLDAETGLYYATFNLSAGNYEYKVAANHDWQVSYGTDGRRDGVNFAFTVTEDGPVTIWFNSETKLSGIDRDALLPSPWIVSVDGNDVDMTTMDMVNYTAEFFPVEAGTHQYSITNRNDADQKIDLPVNVEEDNTTVIISLNTQTAEPSVQQVAPVYSIIGADTGSQGYSGWLGWAEDADMTKGEDGMYSVRFDNMAAGDYMYKVRVNHAWDVNYGLNGVTSAADHIPMTIEADSTDIIIYFDPQTKLTSVVVVTPEAYAVVADDSTQTISQGEAGYTYAKTLTFYYDTKKELRGGMDVSQPIERNQRPWEEASGTIRTVVFDESFASYTGLTSTAYWFEDFFALTSIEGLQYLNTDNVTTMSNMFNWCSSLTSLTIPFNTSNVTDMSEMFFGCGALTDIDVSGMQTGKVTTMEQMFNGDSKLTKLDLSTFDTSSLEDMTWMFWYCSALESVDLSSFNTENVTSMYGLFAECASLSSVNLSNFNTPKLERLPRMFKGCTSMKTIDLSSFSVQKVNDTFDMFSGCTALETVFVNDDWDLPVLDSLVNAGTEAGEYAGHGSNMFTDCTNLVGGRGTAYSADHVDAEYAHIDMAPDNPGYFTRKTQLMGDANDDGVVTVADAVATITNILGQPADGYFAQAKADMNSDNEIDIFDVALIVNAVFSTASSDTTSSRAGNMAPEQVRLTSQAGRMYMGVEEAGQFTAFQFDVTLPEGTELEGVSLASASTGHQLSFQKRAGNTYRVVGLSMTNEQLAAANGRVVQLQLSGNADEASVRMSNVIFVGKPEAGTTAVRNRLNADGQADGAIYDLNGRYVGHDRSLLTKGIYVINHKKVYIK